MPGGVAPETVLRIALAVIALVTAVLNYIGRRRKD